MPPRIKSKTDFELYGIFGHPLKHTLSPPMQEAGFHYAGHHAFYLVSELNLKNFSQVVKNLKRCPLAGFNLTVPYKQDVIKGLDKLTPQARAVGAVNTVYKQKNQWVGTNTDVDGFLTSLKTDAKFRCVGKRVLVIGSGGAARAVLYGLAKEKVRSIVIVNRSLEKVIQLGQQFSKLFPKVVFEVDELQEHVIRQELSCVDLVVNTTSVGLKKGDGSVLKDAWIPKVARNSKILFYDLIYNPAETVFLKQARKKGYRTLNGLGMLLYQGIYAWQCWTKQKAPISVMKMALESALKERMKV